MPIFMRLIDNKITWAGEVNKLGFEKDDGYRIPDEYLEAGKFVILRLCHGFGDWSIISAMPRLLKKKYPNSKIYIPSEKLISETWGDDIEGWKHWPEPAKSAELVFANNPYVDGTIDSFDGEIYHDHYRIWDKDNEDEPMVEQILRFWQLDDEDIKDVNPELYYSEEEKELGDKIIKDYFGDEDFGGLILSTSELAKGEFYGGKIDEKTHEVLKKYKHLKFCFYSGIDIKETPFDYMNVVLDFKDADLSIRMQCYIREKAKINLGYQSSIYDTISSKTEIICTSYTMPGLHGENYGRRIQYV